VKRVIVFAFVLFAALGLFAQDRRPEIGDTGPGGGTIYYWDEETDEYWECSGDLGKATWGQARIDARNYRGGGFDDWNLPGLDHLEQMYYNLKLNGIGRLADDFYWSNSEDTDNLANAGGYKFNGKEPWGSWSPKTKKQRFRAVRSFKWKPSE